MKVRLLILFVLTASFAVGSGWAIAAPEGWTQSNVSGFGDSDNSSVNTLAPFGGQLYAGTSNQSGNGAQLWSKENTGDWVNVISNGFDNPNNEGVAHLIEYKNQLYAGTRNAVEGGKIYRSTDGSTWSPVILPAFDPTNGEIVTFAQHNNYIYASTGSFTNTHGAEIWRSSTGNSGDWAQVVSNGFDGDSNNEKIITFAEYNGNFFAGTDNLVTGAEVWYTSDGVNWTQVNNDGFGDTYNWSVTLEEFDGYLYAGTYNYANSDNPGAELWRCQQCNGTDWQQVTIAKGFGDTENRAIRSLIVHNNVLVAATYNRTSGIEVWHSTNGTSWSQINEDGFRTSNNLSPSWDNSVTVFNNYLYVGTVNYVDGGEVWQYEPEYKIYLPLIVR